MGRRPRPSFRIGHRERAAMAGPRRLGAGDQAVVRRRQEPLEHELDNQELARRRSAAVAEVEAALAAAFEPPPSASPRPPLEGPCIAIPVRRVLANSQAAVKVEAWGFHIWIPRSCLWDPEDTIVTHHLAGELLVSSSWAASHGLPPAGREDLDP